jgi:hypothetical protein
MKTKKPTKSYIRIISKRACEDISVISWFVGLSGAVIAPMIALGTGFSERHGVLEMILVSVVGAIITIAGEFLIRLIRAIPRIHKEQLEEIEKFRTQIENIQTPKISIESISCRKSVEGSCSCRVTIRNLSKMNKAENICVRMSGKDVYKIFYEGYDPFHESDLVPATGNRDINPDSTTDFIFPDEFNQLVWHLSSQTRVLFMGPNAKEKNDEQRKQTFKLTASSSGSVAVQAEFVIPRGHQNDECACIERLN